MNKLEDRVIESTVTYSAGNIIDRFQDYRV